MPVVVPSTGKFSNDRQALASPIHPGSRTPTLACITPAAAAPGATTE